MKDLLHGLLTWIDHNRYVVISLVLSALLIGGMFGALGCSSMTLGLGGDKVTRIEFNREAAEAKTDLAVRKIQLESALTEFNVEVAKLNADIAAGLADLDKQDTVRAGILELVGTTAPQIAAGTLNPWALLPIGIGLFGGLMGLGTAADNRRKDAVIAATKPNA